METEKIQSPEMGATPACGAGAGADTQPHEEERLKQLIKEFESEDFEFLDITAEKLGFIYIDEWFLVDNFGITIAEAVEFYESMIPSYIIIYSPQSKNYYFLKYSENKIERVEKKTADEVREMIKRGGVIE